MSRRATVPMMPVMSEQPSPVLPCPTSPLQQTDSESWEHTRDYPSSYSRYVNDHISDRVSDSPDTEPDHDGD